MYTAKDKADAAYINEHRVGVGRRRLYHMRRKTIDKHLALIDLFAPFGEDPWERYVEEDVAALRAALNLLNQHREP